MSSISGMNAFAESSRKKNVRVDEEKEYIVLACLVPNTKSSALIEKSHIFPKTILSFHFSI